MHYIKERKKDLWWGPDSDKGLVWVILLIFHLDLAIGYSE